ncbi:hypothetical protein Ciccas_011054 [Cichlidogyrus casuarinus]|uniref:Uncharacterized protein n=1 Tax=Cichlidogyrus casuarinus TaxID=1844966 RepID=A0ABD2PSD7_9PLAT
MSHRDKRGRSLIHLAVLKGNINIINLLISRGANINGADEKGLTALHLAVKKGLVDVLKHLLSIGADPENCCNRKYKPIHTAAEMNDVSCLAELLKHPSVDVNAEGEQGCTPVHHCCFRDSANCLTLLLKFGANIYKADHVGSYPIHRAVTYLAENCLKILFDHELSQFHERSCQFRNITRFAISDEVEATKHKAAKMDRITRALVGLEVCYREGKSVANGTLSVEEDSAKIVEEMGNKALVNLIDSEGEI